MSHDAEIAFGPGEEFRIIRRMIRRYGPVATGVGDDAALVQIPPGETMVVSTDSSVEGVHFRREWLSPEEVGYRAATAALSDLAAMGARPVGLLIALTVPAGWRASLDAIGDGLARATAEAGARIIGGDLTRGDALVLTVTVIGALRQGEMLARNAARAGDRLYVTGELGGSAAALAALLAGIEPESAHRARFATPHARVAEARWLAGQGARAAVDLSDGLIADAGHLAAASHVQLVIALDRLPVVAGVTPEQGATSGEEYEVLVASALPLDRAAFADRFSLPLTRIGVVRDGDPAVIATRDGAPVALPRSGFDHFAAR